MKNQLKIRVVFDRVHVATLSTDENPRPGLIQLEARYDGRKIYIGIASVYLDQFGRYNKRTHTTTGETICNRADAERINKQIQTTRETMMADFDRCQALGISFSLDRFTRSTNSAAPDFYEYAQKYIANLSRAKSTIKSKNNSLRICVASGLFHTLADLTPAKIEAFDVWLHQQNHIYLDRQLCPAYINLVHGFLRNICAEALAHGYITADPYRNHKRDKYQSAPRQFLTKDQIELIAGAPCLDSTVPGDKLRDARDLFLLQIYTGMAYIDVQTAPWPAARQTGVLQAQRHKTHSTYIVHLNDAARAILDRWNWCPPRMSSLDLNDYLQLVVCQVLTGQPKVCIQNLAQLPPQTIETLRTMQVVSPKMAQEDFRIIHAIILFMVETGIKYNELVRVDLDEARRSHTLKYIATSQPHEIPLSPEALRLLDVIGWKLPKVQLQTMTKILRRLIVQSVIPALSSHIGRHTFGTIAINAGVPIAVLQRIMGHTNPNTTLIYAKLQPDAILDAFSLIEQKTATDKSK